MEITETEVYGIQQALKSMRNPMKSRDKSDSGWTSLDVANFDKIIETNIWTDNGYVIGDEDDRLSRSLGQCKPGTGHDSWLKGIIVNSTWKADHSFWLQEGRYHHIDIVSSESKMHGITTDNIQENCNPLVALGQLGFVLDLIEVWNKWGLFKKYGYETVAGYVTLTTKKEVFEAIIMNLPIGYELSAGITTNYLQLKTMYAQRRKHKMSSWNTTFRQWVEGLPLSHLITGE